jgi:Cu(I)/Ag(I) efflux system membrane fusion protein
MSRFLDTMERSGAWLWRHTAAAMALVLIVLALVIGYWFGTPAPDADPEEPAATATADAKPQEYMCAMHPSQRSTDPNAKCPICHMDLVPVPDMAGDGVGGRRISISPAAAALSRVETAKVGRFFPTTEVRLYGKVTYDETAVARLTAWFPGRIDRLFVNYMGVPVTQGDHIAELYSPELLAAFEELRQARGAVDAASPGGEFVRETARDTLTASREKLRLFGLSDEQIRGVEDGSFRSDRLTVFAPIRGVVTNLAVREGDYVQTGAPIATVADLSRLWLDMEAYESQLPLLRWGQPVTFTVESHPGERFEGRISFIEPMVDERMRTAAVRVAVDNTDGRLKPGMFASGVVRPRVDERGAVLNDALAGRWVSPMHPQIVKDGPGQCDICGMDLVPAESLGVVGDPSQAVEPLVVPRSAVLFTGTRSVVYVADPDAERPTYEGREVTLGPRAGDFYIVREGLRQGESVVVNGAFRIDSAMQIVAKPSMMSPTGGEGGAGGHAGHAGAGGSPGAASAPGQADAPEAFRHGLDPVYEAYLAGQEALAADDLSGFVQATEDLKTALGAVEEVGLVGESLGAWRRAAGKLRVDRATTTIDDARVRFERMSEGAIELAQRFGPAGAGTLLVAHCPMAFDDKGADWLQRGEQINNPYFGAMMLMCGEIRRTFPAAEGEPDAGSPDDHEGHGHE